MTAGIPPASCRNIAEPAAAARAVAGLVLWAGSLVAALGTAYVSVNVGVHHGSADTRAARATDTPARHGRG